MLAVKLYFQARSRWLLSGNNFWARAILCWLFASLLLKLDAIESYDTRFKIRGSQARSLDVVLVTINPNDYAQISKIFSSDKNLSSLISINELNNVTDSFFWDEKIWSDLLTQILIQKPKKIGVTLFFGDNIGKTILNKKNLDLFKNQQIIWASNSSFADKTSMPFTTTLNRSNIGSIDLLKDDDGIVRRALLDPDQMPSMAERLAAVKDPLKKSSQVINFNGSNRFQSISMKSILKHEVPPNFFTNKIVLIGSEKTNNQQILTPFGQMSRHEFWGQVTDNFVHEKFIRKLPILIYVVLLLLLTIVCAFIITSYPQAVSLFFFAWLGTVWTAASIWTFDTFAIWIPVASAYALIVLIWITYIGYQALRIEKAHYKLQQEQNYLSELEQLKNNFVSLISHDLKTPIAKIQAVVDRLNLQNNLPVEKRPETKDDLNNLKDYSEELNRYIQSILKLLRVESKEFKIHKETADLNGVIENVVERLKPLAAAKNIDLQLNLEPMFLIEFDVTLVTEVILNLIENAIKYTANNGVVNVHTTETDFDVLVEVTDTGEGISQQDLEHIWKKFTRGKNQDLKTKGSGLGLYLAKYFIELHGGKISVKSELGKGTAFYIRLPIETN
ncbi:MAG: CHASE2 domain-containing protein [Moraxellaceae bacterium]|nr:CHASE2 domain-containing protein [Pseudobdellovibrionaceae bacterium]